MILISIFDPHSREVLSHAAVSAPEMVAYAVPHGCAALVGRHIPFGELAPEGFEIVIPALPETKQIVLPVEPTEMVSR